LGFWNRLKQKAETTKDLTKPPGFNESPRDQNVHRTPKILTASSLKKKNLKTKIMEKDLTKEGLQASLGATRKKTEQMKI